MRGERLTFTAVLTVLFSTLLLSEQASSLDLGIPNLQVNGFGTVSLNKGESDTLGFRNTLAEEGVFDEWSIKSGSSLGLQFDYQAFEKLDFTLQLLAKDRADNSLSESITSAFIRYDISPKWELTLGRTPPDVYLLSDHRNVSYAFPWVKPPLEYYGTLTNEYADGIGVKRFFPTDSGVGLIGFYLVETDYKLFRDSSIKYSGDLSPTIGIKLEWENDTWLWQLSAVQSEYSANDSQSTLLDSALTNLQGLWPESTSLVGLYDLEDEHLRYFSAGIRYMAHDWIVQSELGVIQTPSIALNDLKRGYLLVGKKFGKFTPHFTYSSGKNSKVTIPEYQINPLLPTAVNAQILGLRSLLIDEVARTHLSQTTLSLGVRYDLSPTTALKLQWDRTEIDESAAGVLDAKPSLLYEAQSLNRFTISMDFIF